MTTKLESVLRRLAEFQFTGTYLERLDSLMDELRADADAKDAIDPILHFIEDHPQEDLGAPGPLVHFVEQFYGDGYEELLLRSVKRRPTKLTVWMLNRLANGAGSSHERDRYITTMHEIAAGDSDARVLAQDFLNSRSD